LDVGRSKDGQVTAHGEAGADDRAIGRVPGCCHLQCGLGLEGGLERSVLRLPAGRLSRGRSPLVTKGRWTGEGATTDWARGGRRSAPQVGAVTREGVRKTEVLWLRFRDSWAKFGTVRYPKVPENTWKMWATMKRIAQLKEILNAL
jgi:hypothetical protein